MISNLLTVSEQVLILFVLIIIGVILQKAKLIEESGIRTMANIVLFAVTPCVIIKAFQRDFDPSMLSKLGLSFAISLATFIFSIALVEILYRKYKTDRITVIKFAVVFSNVGYMGLPLQEAVLGEDGLFFGAAYVAVFNMVMWTYGFFIMSGKNDAKSMLKGLLNPGVTGTLVAFVLYVFNIHLPDVLYVPVSHMAALNTPLPMIIIGYYLASSDLRKAFTNRDVYLSQLLRLVIIPLAAVFILYFAGVRGSLYIAMVISVSAPTAVAATLMSTRYNKDTLLAASIVSASSLFSIITMPLIVALAQTLNGGA